MVRSSLVLRMVTDPGVAVMSEMSVPLRQKVQRAPAGVVVTEICCVVTSKMEAQPLVMALSRPRPAVVASARESANREIPASVPQFVHEARDDANIAWRWMDAGGPDRSVVAGQFGRDFAGGRRIEVGALLVAPPDDLAAPLLEVIVGPGGPVDLDQHRLLTQHRLLAGAHLVPIVEDVVAQGDREVGAGEWLVD